jgi:hypothetical protein
VRVQAGTQVAFYSHAREKGGGAGRSITEGDAAGTRPRQGRGIAGARGSVTGIDGRVARASGMGGFGAGVGDSAAGLSWLVEALPFGTARQ